MKNYLIIGVVFFIISCSNDKKTEPLRTQNSSLKIDTIITHHPNNNEIEIIDTLLDIESNFHVYIKKSSLRGNYIVQTYEGDSNEILKHIYHDNSILIKIMSGKNILMDTLLLKEKLSQIGDKEFLSKSILWNAWIEDFNKEKQEVELSFTVLVPDTDWAYDFSAKVSASGKKEIVLDEIE